MLLKEDLQASPAEMLYGTTLRLPGEFFVSQSIQAHPTAFVTRLRALFQDIRAVSASIHAKYRAFQHGHLDTCSHVFLRNDTVRKPLQPPYTGSHEVVRRVNDKVYVIKVYGVEKTVSTDGLKPAYLEAADELPRPTQPSDEPLHGSPPQITLSTQGDLATQLPSPEPPPAPSPPQPADQETVAQWSQMSKK